MLYWLILLDQSEQLLVESFTNGKVQKTKGVSASETSKFECTIADRAKVRTRKFKETLMLDLRHYREDHKFIV
jgi:hypothetical protein